MIIMILKSMYLDYKKNMIQILVITIHPKKNTTQYLIIPRVLSSLHICTILNKC